MLERIGLGNIWLFSWKLGKYGGAAFLIPYFIFIALFAVVGLVGDFIWKNDEKGIFGLPEIIKIQRYLLRNICQ